MNAGNLIENIVPTSAFNRGKSAQCFERVADGAPIIVMKNNAPYRVVVTPDDFVRLSEVEEDNALLVMSLSRLEANVGKPAVPAEDAYRELGVNPDEIDAMEDVELA